VSRWSDATGGATGRDYAARFDELEATGADVHGEASLCASLVPAGARVLDAGCGTGRVAIRLAELGYDVTGVDLDESMLEVARERAPRLSWLGGDLATLDLGTTFDLVLMAGNIVPLVAEGSEPAVLARMAVHLAPGGLLVAGFGLDRAHLPAAAALVRIEDYDTWCASAGLTPAHRFATWDRAAYTDGAGYAVSVHTRPVSAAG
jgi:SAM-dependent methyltransferase